MSPRRLALVGDVALFAGAIIVGVLVLYGGAQVLIWMLLQHH